MSRLSLIVCALVLVGGSAIAEVIGLDIVYRHGDQRLVGYLAYEVKDNRIRPGVLICPEWWGINDYVRQRARELAELGLMVFVCDIYGDSTSTTSWEEAPKLAKPFYEDRDLMRERVAIGLWTLRNHTLCDKGRIAAIGYCFGGTCALELARSGAEVQGVVSFHGGLNTPDPEDAKNIKTKVLVCHGADDPFVNADEVAAFQNEMRDAGVDWQMNIYGGAVHSFTNPVSGDDPSTGVAYNVDADRRSWDAMMMFFEEIFK